MDLALLMERCKDRDGVISWVYPLRVSPTSKLNKIKSKVKSEAGRKKLVALARW